MRTHKRIITGNGKFRKEEGGKRKETENLDNRELNSNERIKIIKEEEIIKKRNRPEAIMVKVDKSSQ